jgi:hypothetical protein
MNKVPTYNDRISWQGLLCFQPTECCYYFASLPFLSAMGVHRPLNICHAGDFHLNEDCYSAETANRLSFTATANQLE